MARFIWAVIDNPFNTSGPCSGQMSLHELENYVDLKLAYVIFEVPRNNLIFKDTFRENDWWQKG